MVVLTFVYVFNLFTFWSSSYFLGNIAPADREVGRSFDPVLVWKSTAGDSKEGLFFFHTWCAAGAIHYWGYPFEDRILMTSVAVWGSKQHNSEGTIRGKRHSWLRGFPKTGYYGEHPLQGARCWCWWWSWWWRSLWWSWWFMKMKKYTFSIIVFFENKCVICILWKSTDAKFRFLGSDCQDLQRHRPLCRSSSRWLCCALQGLCWKSVQLYLSSFLVEQTMMVTFQTGRRGDVFSVVAHIKFLPLPKQLETRSCATQTSGWRSWRKQIPAIEITFRWMIRSFAGPYLCQLAAHPPLALVLFFCSLFLE